MVFPNTFANFAPFFIRLTPLMYNISIKSSFLIVVAAGCFLSVKAQNVQFQPLDSAYLADLEAMMLQTEKEQKAREVIQEYENKMLHRELAFHFDGLAEIIHGGINAWRNNDFLEHRRIPTATRMLNTRAPPMPRDSFPAGLYE